MKRLSLFVLSLLVAWGMTIPQVHAETQGQIVIPGGSRPTSAAPKQNFTGNVRVAPAFDTQPPQRIYGAYVTFEPGARTYWHMHPLGQTLIVTSGVGLTQQWGGPIQVIRQGDVVLCPPNIKHWHGAAPATSMTHLAIGERLDSHNVTWMEEVSDSQYTPQ